MSRWRAANAALLLHPKLPAVTNRGTLQRYYGMLHTREHDERRFSNQANEPLQLTWTVCEPCRARRYNFQVGTLCIGWFASTFGRLFGYQDDSPRSHAGLSVLVAVGDNIVTANGEGNVCNCRV